MWMCQAQGHLHFEAFCRKILNLKISTNNNKTLPRTTINQVNLPTDMLLSSTEHSFLYESLRQSPPIRPDGRSNAQFRPMESEIDIVNGSNGSAKITLSDGSECLVSIKASIAETRPTKELVAVDVEINGERDDSNLTLTLKSVLQSLYLNNVTRESLKLTEKFSWKLNIDVLIIAKFSYPLTLISQTAFLAINHTLLPKLTSSVDDKEIEEQPQFDEYEMEKLDLELPIIFTLAVIDKNYIIDPNLEELEVCDNGLIISWFNGKVISPLTNVKLNDSNLKSIKPALILDSVKLVEKIGGKVVDSLKSV